MQKSLPILEFKQAFDALKTTQSEIQARWPNLQMGIDVVELRSYHYHTGLMYAVYAPNRAAPLAQGGRYDGIGEHFGVHVQQLALVVTYMHSVQVVSAKQSCGCTQRYPKQI